MFKLQEKVQSGPLGLYLHVPFCARACDFCQFYQEPPQRRDIERYLNGVEACLGAYSDERSFTTVFFGGGTPGLLPCADLERICRAVLTANRGQAPQEWTVEMAPATVKRDKIRALLDHGVTRISMGVQSFNEARLAALGRVHSLAQVWRAIEILHAGQVPNINLDLIFAIPGQSVEDWAGELQTAIGAGTQHLSTYCLTFEEDTALWLRLQRGQVSKISEDEEAAYFEVAWEILGNAGFRQYEVSNYAREGHACLHNLNTWRMEEWLGVGPSASSQYNGWRWTEPHSLDIWLQGLAGGPAQQLDRTPLSNSLLQQDALIFGLRMNEGVDLGELRRRWGELPPAWDILQKQLVEAGYAQVQADRIRLTPTGRLLADRIGEEILTLEPDR